MSAYRLALRAMNLFCQDEDSGRSLFQDVRASHEDGAETPDDRTGTISPSRAKWIGVGTSTRWAEIRGSGFSIMVQNLRTSSSPVSSRESSALTVGNVWEQNLALDRRRNLIASVFHLCEYSPFPLDDSEVPSRFLIVFVCRTVSSDMKTDTSYRAESSITG